MTTKRIKITLIQHPTVALKIHGFNNPGFDEFAESGLYLGNIYRRVIPDSLSRLASIMERELEADVDILDLRVLDPNREETYKVVDWDGYTIDVRRVGASFSHLDKAVEESDWIGLSNHFTFESGIIRDLITYIRKIKPTIKIIVGGADVTARPHEYLSFGANLATVGDFDPQAFIEESASEKKVLGPNRIPFKELIDPAFNKLHYLSEYKDSHDGPVPEGVQSPIGFIYFTRGCPRECDFCESRKTKYEALDVDNAVTMLENYRAAGIKTLNLSDDNFLLQAANKDGRTRLLDILKVMREMDFAWEFPNGLEIGRLMRKDGLDEELMEALFRPSTDPVTGNIVGGYRLYVPVETFDHRADYRKLKSVQDQNTIIAGLASSGLLEIDFGVILPPDTDSDTIQHTKDGYSEIKDIVTSNGDAKARYAVFHLIPISEFRKMPTKYSVDEFPEGWNFYFPNYDGTYFSARRLFEERLQLVKDIDFQNYQSMRKGQYDYS